MTKKNQRASFKIGLAMVGFGLIFAQAGLAVAGKKTFDQQMKPILKSYLEISTVLASDKTEGVVEAAKSIGQLATKLNTTAVTGEHAKHFRDIPENLLLAAKKMSKAKDIASMREALKDLSKPMVKWATIAKPKGVNIAYCSMAPGSWLQHGTTISNPYYGSKMLRCGEIKAGDSADKKSGHSRHGGHGH